MHHWRMGIPAALLALLLSGISCGGAGEQVDLLVTGGTVVTMDADRRVIENGAVAVHAGHIVAVGTAEELEVRYRPRQWLRVEGRLVLPGLINAHTHAAMSLYRGVADDLALEEWLRDYIFPLEAQHTTAEFVYWGTKLAALEMIRGGITTFADMYYFEEQVARAASEAGLRVVAGETILDFPSPDFATPAEALRYTEEFIRRWRDHPLVVPAVAPHSAYACSADTLQAAATLAERAGVPLLIHLAETRAEVEEGKKRNGQTPVQYLAKLGVLTPHTVAKHCVWVNERDRVLLAEKGASCVHNPSSNMKLASGVMALEALRAAGVAVGLGTDGPAGSNNDFNLFEEMDLAAKLQKVTSGDPRALPAAEALALATSEGARALGLGQEIGSIEPGKRADLIVVRRDAPHALPAYDVYSQIVYSLKASDVESSIINGQVVLQQGRVLTLDEREVKQQARRFAAAVRKTRRKKD